MSISTPPSSPSPSPSSSPFNFGQWEDIFKFYRQPRRPDQHKNILDQSLDQPPPHPWLTSSHKSNNRTSGSFSGSTTRQQSRFFNYGTTKVERHVTQNQNHTKKSAPMWAVAEPWPRSIGPSALPHDMTFKESMLHNAFNVKSLVIGENQRIAIDPSDHLFLPALKELTWHSDSFGHAPTRPRDPAALIKNNKPAIDIQRRQSIYRILLAAPNLELIKDFHFDTDYDLVLTAHKVHTIQKLCIFDTVNVDHLQQFVEANPRLTVLQLVDTGGVFLMEPSKKAKLCSVIRLLFQSSYDTLKILDLSQFCSVVDIQIPYRLSNLEQLIIGSAAHVNGLRASRVLPSIIYLDKTFPNLRVLDCTRLKSDDNSNWYKYFPSETFFRENFNTVKVLVISDTLTFYFMDKLKHHLCQNFTKLIVESHGHDNSLDFMMMKIFRYWQHLQSLTIKIKDFQGPTLSLDSTITGLQEETCSRLRAFGQDAGLEHDQTIISMQATQPSIANLSKLKTLDIILGHDCLGKLAFQPDQDDEQTSKPLLSFVSGRYGFSKVPDLKIGVTFDQHCPWGQEILRRFHGLISPDVKLKQKQDRCCCRATAA